MYIVCVCLMFRAAEDGSVNELLYWGFVTILKLCVCQRERERELKLYLRGVPREKVVTYR